MSKYFIEKNSSKHGPLTLEQLKNFKINGADLIWKEGSDYWVKAETLPELADIIQIEIPKQLQEKYIPKKRLSYNTYYLIPLLFGIIIGFISISSWNKTKQKAYSDYAWVNSQHNLATPYSEFLDKYLAGKYGFSAGTDNENFYYENTDQGIFRPLKAIMAMFNSKTQFYVGKNESAPYFTFFVSWIAYCFIIYLIVYGIRIVRRRSTI